MSLLVVKVGGSLYDLPDLRQRLQQWLAAQVAEAILLVPGGGETTNVIRHLDRVHGFTEHQSHNLALYSLELNARFLSMLLGDLPIVNSPLKNRTGIAILNAADTYVRDDFALPASWDTTSDSIAAQVALVADAEELILLKSVEVSSDLSWEQAAQEGIVDPLFPTLATQLRKVRVVNLRAMTMT